MQGHERIHIGALLRRSLPQEEGVSQRPIVIAGPCLQQWSGRNVCRSSEGQSLMPPYCGKW